MKNGVLGPAVIAKDGSLLGNMPYIGPGLVIPCPPISIAFSPPSLWGPRKVRNK